MKTIAITLTCLILAVAALAGVTNEGVVLMQTSWEKNAWPNDTRRLNIKKIMESSVCTLLVYDKSGNRTGHGSAIIIAPDLAITCWHVIAGAHRAVGKFPHGGYIEMTQFMWQHYNPDICVMRFRDPENLAKPIIFIDPLLMLPADPVYAIGASKGFEGTITAGIISGRRIWDDGTDLFQTDAAISEGCSGGALVNINGYLVGMISFYWKSGENMTFAISNAEITKELKYCTYLGWHMTYFPYAKPKEILSY